MRLEGQLYCVLEYTLAFLGAFLCGMALMLLEIIGARYLTRFFGGAFYVWTGQIAVILIALCLGYFIGGVIADRYRRLSIMVILVFITGIYLLMIPWFAPKIMDLIVLRHPFDQPIPEIWRKIDPALGSISIFFMPSLIIGMVSPFLVRYLSSSLHYVGHITGAIYGISTIGNILGLFVGAYWLIDYFSVSAIFRVSGFICVIASFVLLVLDLCRK